MIQLFGITKEGIIVIHEPAMMTNNIASITCDQCKYYNCRTSLCFRCLRILPPQMYFIKDKDLHLIEAVYPNLPFNEY